MRLRKGRHGGVVGAHPPPLDGDWVDEHGRLSQAGRALIQIRRSEGRCPARIAAELGVHRSTVGRELARNTRLGRYHAAAAQVMTEQRRPRPRPSKLAVRADTGVDAGVDAGVDGGAGEVLRAAVLVRLNNRFSPVQVSQDLRRCYPGRDDMQVSHETIYQALYVQGKGSLREELKVEKALRSGRTSRRPRSALPPRSNRSWIGAEAHISHRPPEAADRAVPGHWEGDLVIGAGGRSALITLVERSTRYALIRRLPLTHDATTVAAALVTMMTNLPESLRRSLTWDQGSEMAAHTTFTLATGCPVYFADPHSPWQRGTNENTNGLVRDIHSQGHRLQPRQRRRHHRDRTPPQHPPPPNPQLGHPRR
ncbi:IS30 family transposase [Nocardioides zeae]|uniref:IS30 family transposase n=1 Tax=Nocardioides zeae TaxID=1457234 RepID=A0AAJ1U3B3_9ACTN|nr:IS30 family transposase [Nocardioides zeae]MDQ1105135.1 IS30 family transposase [Nocardioides zeae]